MKGKIGGHNKKILETTLPPEAELCNSLRQENCPMKGACLTENVLYYSKISCGDGKYKREMYKEIYQTTAFQIRYANHKKSFNAEKKRTRQNYLLNTVN